MSSSSHLTSITMLCRSKEDVEKCKQKDLLEQTMSEMIGEFPALHQTIVAERDIYLTHTLRQATRCVEAPSNAQSNYYYYTFSNNYVLICYFLILVIFITSFVVSGSFNCSFEVIITVICIALNYHKRLLQLF